MRQEEQAIVGRTTDVPLLGLLASFPHFSSLPHYVLPRGDFPVVASSIESVSPPHKCTY
jgi:hypothetical protein